MWSRNAFFSLRPPPLVFGFFYRNLVYPPGSYIFYLSERARDWPNISAWILQLHPYYRPVSHARVSTLLFSREKVVFSARVGCSNGFFALLEKPLQLIFNNLQAENRIKIALEILFKSRWNHIDFKRFSLLPKPTAIRIFHRGGQATGLLPRIRPANILDPPIPSFLKISGVSESGSWWNIPFEESTPYLVLTFYFSQKLFPLGRFK